MNSEQIGKRTTINSIHLSKNSNDMSSMREKYNSITSGGQKSQSSGGIKSKEESKSTIVKIKQPNSSDIEV